MTTPTFQARPTTYKGIKMRSRLEARFAQWLDNREDNWEYEPNAFGSQNGQYLPDFKVKWRDDDPNDYIEIKPLPIDLLKVLAKMHIILESEPNARLLVGCPMEADYEDFKFPAQCAVDAGCGSCDRPVKPGDVITFNYEWWQTPEHCESGELILIASTADIAFILSAFEQYLAKFHGGLAAPTWFKGVPE